MPKEIWIAISEDLIAFDTKELKDKMGIPFADNFEAQAFLSDEEYEDYIKVKEAFYAWSYRLHNLHKQKMKYKR